MTVWAQIHRGKSVGQILAKRTYFLGLHGLKAFPKVSWFSQSRERAAIKFLTASPWNRARGHVEGTKLASRKCQRNVPEIIFPRLRAVNHAAVRPKSSQTRNSFLHWKSYRLYETDVFFFLNVAFIKWANGSHSPVGCGKPTLLALCSVKGFSSSPRRVLQWFSCKQVTASLEILPLQGSRPCLYHLLLLLQACPL